MLTCTLESMLICSIYCRCFKCGFFWSVLASVSLSSLFTLSSVFSSKTYCDAKVWSLEIGWMLQVMLCLSGEILPFILCTDKGHGYTPNLKKKKKTKKNA